MKNKLQLKKLLLSAICLFSVIACTEAQSNGNNTKDRKVGIDTLSQIIERKHGVRIYYDSGLFTGKSFSISYTNLPLESCFDIISNISGLTYLKPDSASCVFVPVEIRDFTGLVDNKGSILIGDQSNLGKNTITTVMGKIIDAKSNKPLYGAKVEIEDSRISSSTDREGNYKLRMPSGEYDIRINYPGFEEDNRHIKVGGDGIVNFVIAEKTIRLKEIIFSDKAMDFNVKRTQMSTIKLGANVIKELPVFLGERDIIKSITLMPGVQSTGEFGTGFFVRGGSSDQNLILVEDVPLFNPSHMFGIHSSLNPDGVKEVTMMKSGIPAKYGERVSSVMDIRLGSDAEKASFTGGIGLMDTRLNLHVPFKDKKGSLLIGGRTSYSNWLLHKMPDSELKNSSASFNDINVLLNFRINDNNNFTLFAYKSEDNFSFAPTAPYHYQNTLASFKFTHKYSEKMSSTLVFGTSNYKNDESEKDNMKPEDAFFLNSSLDYKLARLDFNWVPKENHNLDFGLNYVRYFIEPGTIEHIGTKSKIVDFSVDNEKAAEISAYMSDDIAITPLLSLQAGLRFTRFAGINPDSNNVLKWYSSFEPRVSMRYTLDDFSSLKMSYNRISQYINLISNTSVMSPTDVYKLCSPNVKPVICDQFAIGYFRNFNNNMFEASLELYYKNLNNILEYRDGAKILLNNNLEDDLLEATGYNYGAELLLRKNSGKLTGWASYTYSKSMRHTTSPVKADQINRNEYYPSYFDKPHNLVLVANYHVTRRWRVAGTFTYNTGRPVTLPEMKYDINGRQYVYYSDRNKYRLPDFHRLDLSITRDETLRLRQKWKGSWTVSLLNVYARHNAYSVFYQSTSKLENKFYQSFNLYKLSIMNRPIPTLTYNFKF